MSKIKIERMSDWNDCEQCGGGSEDGGRVIIDDVVVYEHIPVAGCFGNKDVSEMQLISIALKHLGHDFEVTWVDFDDLEDE